jgi:hypothetical protein
MEWTARGGPSVFGFIDAIASDMPPLICKRPARRARRSGLPDLRTKNPISGRPEIGAQFQLWIFSYHILSGLANLVLSRLIFAWCGRMS